LADLFTGFFMTVLVIKDLPEVLHSRLKARALRNHRSMTREAVAVLERGMDVPETPSNHMDALAALTKVGAALRDQGVDFAAWAGQSREVWR
jgi:plasmid stability protein